MRQAGAECGFWMSEWGNTLADQTAGSRSWHPGKCDGQKMLPTRTFQGRSIRRKYRQASPVSCTRLVQRMMAYTVHHLPLCDGLNLKHVRETHKSARFQGVSPRGRQVCNDGACGIQGMAQIIHAHPMRHHYVLGEGCAAHPRHKALPLIPNTELPAVPLFRVAKQC
jgi:hypothetical protein